MFRSLSAKLVASYVIVVFLALSLSSIASAALITATQRRVNLARAHTIAVGIVQRISTTLGLRLWSEEAVDRLQREGERLGSRILLIGPSGQVLVDSGDSYTGQQVPLPPRPATPLLAPRPVRRHVFGDRQEYLLAYVVLTEAQRERLQASYLAAAVQVSQVDPPWRELFIPLTFVGLFVTAAAAGLGWLIAHSITRPVTEMTRASEAIAQGRFGYPVLASDAVAPLPVHIPAGRDDEIARLGHSFNHMAQEVERSQRVQRDLLANISHDLKTPLTSIQGFAQAILDGAVTDTQGYFKSAQIIKTESDRMIRLVQDLLDLARLESGQLQLQAQPVSLVKLVASEVRKCAPHAEQRGQTFELSFPANVPDIVADAHRLEQVLANLLDNACQYSTAGSTIVVEVVRIDPGAPRPAPLSVAFGQPLASGGWIGVSITNQCTPIPTVDLPQVFERFYRVDRSRGQGEGQRLPALGLGLAIVRETVLAHGGRVEASSDTGGTCFRIWLPVVAK